MAKRSKTSQSKHDTEVRRIARDLKNKGYEVKADVKGFPQPKTVGGYRPDVVATKGKQRKIIEAWIDLASSFLRPGLNCRTSP